MALTLEFLNSATDQALAQSSSCVAKIEIGRNHNPAMTTYESAERWNEAHPPGTPVRITLRNGETCEARTAGRAQQWGGLALIKLKDRPGVWTATALEAVKS